MVSCNITFSPLEMYSKWRYKICTCLVILGKLESFRNYTEGLSIIFPNFRGNLSYYESDNFLIPPSIIFSNPKILAFLFLYEISP